VNKGTYSLVCISTANANTQAPLVHRLYVLHPGFF
jgi:hypothetical protein